MVVFNISHLHFCVTCLEVKIFFTPLKLHLILHTYFSSSLYVTFPTICYYVFQTYEFCHLFQCFSIFIFTAFLLHWWLSWPLSFFILTFGIKTQFWNTHYKEKKMFPSSPLVTNFFSLQDYEVTDTCIIIFLSLIDIQHLQQTKL